LVGTDPTSETGRAVAARLPTARLVGRVPIAQVPDYLAAAHVVVVPQRDSSDTRGQVPAKLFDAMALDRPDEARSLGAAARRRAVERYSFEAGRRALFPLVERVRGARAPRR